MIPADPDGWAHTTAEEWRRAIGCSEQQAIELAARTKQQRAKAKECGRNSSTDVGKDAMTAADL
jgi:hypothetical protein